MRVPCGQIPSKSPVTIYTLAPRTTLICTLLYRTHPPRAQDWPLRLRFGHRSPPIRLCGALKPVLRPGGVTTLASAGAAVLDRILRALTGRMVRFSESSRTDG